MVLAEAQVQAGNTANAELERRAALAALEEYGAVREAADLRSLLEEPAGSGTPEVDDPAGGGAHPPDATLHRPPAEFSLSGDMRTASFDGRTSTLGDLKGFRYLERLLAEPGREFHVLDLVAVEAGTLGTRPRPRPDLDTETTLGGGGLPVIDEQARATYRRRLQEVDEDIEDATRCNDPERAELARRDRDYLIAELRRAVGLGGRHRSVGSDAERARTSVARSVRYALGRLADHHPAAAAQLTQGISTGVYCSYTPDPLGRTHWRVGRADRSVEDR